MIDCVDINMCMYVCVCVCVVVIDLMCMCKKYGDSDRELGRDR